MPFDLLTFLEPLFNLLMAAASAAVLALVPPLVKMFLQKIKLDGLVSDDIVRGYLEKALANGILLAKTKIAEQKVVVDVDNTIVASTLVYLRQNVPDALAHFGLTEAKVAELVKARLSTAYL